MRGHAELVPRTAGGTVQHLVSDLDQPPGIEPPSDLKHAAALPPEAAGKPVESWFTDEARVGQQGTLSRVWAKRGSRPRALAIAVTNGPTCSVRSVRSAALVPRLPCPR